jgi:LuxR family maltose regulon positive regulatory protein
MTKGTGEVPYAHLSPRELEVVKQLSLGHSYAQISTQLEISENTLKTHIKRIYRKLKVHNRTQAVLMAHELQQKSANA